MTQLVILALLGEVLAAEKVVRHVENEAMLDRAFVVSAASLGTDSAEVIARQCLAPYRGKKRVVSLLFGVDEMEVRRSLYHQVAKSGADCDQDYSWLAAHIKSTIQTGAPKRGLARVIMVGQNAVFSYRDSSGVSERRLFGQRDPIRFRDGGTDYEILHVAVSEASEAVSPQLRQGAIFFLRTSPRLSIRDCVAATRRLASQAGVGSVSVLFRRDPWFLERPEYPGFPAFVGGMKEITVGEYLTAPFVSCDVHPVFGLRCSGRGFFP
jgi:hypothetical protein